MGFYSVLRMMLMTASSCYFSWQAVQAAWSKGTGQAPYLASNLFPPGLLVVHNPSTGGQYDLAKLQQQEGRLASAPCSVAPPACTTTCGGWASTYRGLLPR